MSNLSKIIPDNNELDFEQCGEIVLFRKHNIVAMKCKFCTGIFMRVPEFQRHLQRHHNDILQIPNMPPDIYTVEELLDMKTEGDNDDSQFESQSHKIRDQAATPKPSDYDHPDFTVKSKSEERVRDCISELLHLEHLNVNDFCQELAKIDDAETAKNDDEKSTKVFQPKSRNGKQDKENRLVTNKLTKAGKTQPVLKPLNLLNDSLRLINKDSKEPNELKEKSSKPDVSVSLPIMTETATAHSALFKINFTESDITFEEKENKPRDADWQKRPQQQRVPLSMHVNEVKQRKASSKCDNKSYAIAHRTTKKKELLHRMSNVKKRILKSLASDYKTPQQQGKEQVEIRNVEILPNVIEQRKVELHNESALPSFKTPNLLKTSTKRDKASTAGSSARFKLECQTPLSSDESNIKNIINKQSLFNGRQNALVGSKRSRPPPTSENNTEPLPVKHLKREPKMVPSEVTSVSLVTREVRKRYIADDVELLKTVGLPILIDLKYEDRLLLEEYEQLHERATKFANLLKAGDLIWHAKHHKAYSLQADLQKEFQKLLQRTNAAFGSNLLLTELRRIVNLITIWYAKQCDAQLLDKKLIPQAYEFFFKLFAYMPKTLRRRFYCEFCEEHFSNENKYNAHRNVHTGMGSGSKSLLSCGLCPKTFKRQSSLDKHAKIHT